MENLTEMLNESEKEGEINSVEWLESRLSTIEELFEIDKQCRVLGQPLYEHLAKCLEEVNYDGM
jgi:hypothetical protein